MIISKNMSAKIESKKYSKSLSLFILAVNHSSCLLRLRLNQMQIYLVGLNVTCYAVAQLYTIGQNHF